MVLITWFWDGDGGVLGEWKRVNGWSGLRLMENVQGTDLNGRRRIEAFMQRLDPDTRRRREVHLAEYAGFRMRRDGTLDYGTSVSVIKQGKKWCNLM